MLTSGKFDGIFNEIARLRREYDEAVRTGANAQLIAELGTNLAAALAAAAQSPQVAMVVGTLFKIGKDYMQTTFDEAQLSPCDAAGPARHAEKAYEALEGGIARIRRWAYSLRFAPLPIPLRDPLEVRVPPNEIKRQIEYLQGLFDAALREAELGTIEILRLRDVRVHLGAEHAPIPHPSLHATDYLIDLPEGPPSSEEARVQTMRLLLLQIADQLELAAKQGRKALKHARIDHDGELMRPAEVTAVLADLNYTLASGILTCAELRRLASEPSIERTQRLAADPKDPPHAHPPLAGAT